MNCIELNVEPHCHFCQTHSRHAKCWIIWYSDKIGEQSFNATEYIRMAIRYDDTRYIRKAIELNHPNLLGLFNAMTLLT